MTGRLWTECGCVPCVLSTAIELQFQSLLDQTEREDSVPQAVRHYLQEMAELTELAKERLDQVKVRLIADSTVVPRVRRWKASCTYTFRV